MSLQRFTIFVLTSVAAIVILVPLAEAQFKKSNCVTTKVGSPTGEPSLPSDCKSAGNTDGKPGGVPPPDYPADLPAAIKQQFGITITGFDQTHQKWIWEKLWDISNTRFAERAQGAYVTANGGDGSGSRQTSCGAPTSVLLAQYSGEAIFKFLFTHELGHFIRNCNARADIKYTEHLNAFAAEGAISYYGGHAATCTGSNNHSEDYADMVAYYVNPEAGLVSVGNCAGIPTKFPPNPYFKEAPPKKEHYNVIKEVL